MNILEVSNSSNENVKTGPCCVMWVMGWHFLRGEINR
jgi:hypothetical protein